MGTFFFFVEHNATHYAYWVEYEFLLCVFSGIFVDVFVGDGGVVVAAVKVWAIIKRKCIEH